MISIILSTIIFITLSISINLQLQRASQSYDECGGGEQLEARQHYLSRPAAKYKRQRWGTRYYHLYKKDNFKELIIELIILIEE